MLEVGTTAPEIDLEDAAGNPVRLADYRGRDNVLLYFLRTTTCPVCNNHVRDLVAQRAELASADVRVLIAAGSVLIDRQGIVRHAHGATVPVRSYDKKGLARAIQDLLPASAVSRAER